MKGTKQLHLPSGMLGFCVLIGERRESGRVYNPGHLFFFDSYETVREEEGSRIV